MERYGMRNFFLSNQTSACSLSLSFSLFASNVQFNLAPAGEMAFSFAKRASKVREISTRPSLPPSPPPQPKREKEGGRETVVPGMHMRNSLS